MRIISGTLIAVILLILFFVSFALLDRSWLEKDLLTNISTFILPILEAILVLLVAIIIRSVLFIFIDKWLSNYPVDITKSLKTATSVFLISLSIPLILVIFTRDTLILSIVIAGSLLAILISSKDIIEDFIIRFLLLSTSSLNIGDFIQVKDICGRIAEFGLMYTTIRRSDNSLVCIPNKILISNIVVNFSKAPHLRFQDSIELKIDEKETNEIVNKIQNELALSGFEAPKIDYFMVGENMKFIVSISLDDPTSIQSASKALTKCLKKIQNEVYEEK